MIQQSYKRPASWTERPFYDFDTSKAIESRRKIQRVEDASRLRREEYEEMLESSLQQRPTFLSPLLGKEHYIEGQNAHFETRLEPVGDPTMVVEWFWNGRPLTVGHRFRTYYDFSYIALDILKLTADDSGTLMLKATNSKGIATLSKTFKVERQTSVDTTTIHSEGYEKIERLEHSTLRQKEHKVEEDILTIKPRFSVPLRDGRIYRELETIHLECFLVPVNDPGLVLEWLFNGKYRQTTFILKNLKINK